MITNVSGQKIVQGQPISNQNATASRTYSPSDLVFGQLLKERLAEQNTAQDPIRFSKHASMRMEQRGVIMDTQKMLELTQAVAKARSKGAKDVAVIGRDEVYIVNVPNNTVVTTVTGGELKDNIFTNIDSAVIL